MNKTKTRIIIVTVSEALTLKTKATQINSFVLWYRFANKIKTCFTSDQVTILYKPGENKATHLT